MREGRHATDGKTGLLFRLVGRGPADRFCAKKVLETFDADTVIAGAEHDQRTSVGDEDERFHDPRDLCTDLSRRILGGTGRGGETHDRELHAALGSVRANADDVGVVRR